MSTQNSIKLPHNTHLIIVDVQKGFEDSIWGARNNGEAESNIARLLHAWRRKGMPISHIQHASRSSESPLHPNKPGYQIKDEVAPEKGEAHYTKHVNSSFIGTTLEQDLRAGDVTHLVVVGLTTNHCVSTTARMAGNLDFVTFVVADATATFDRRALDGTMRPAREVHLAALSDLSEEFATIVSTAEVLQALDRE